jgi:hypothetical protein
VLVGGGAHGPDLYGDRHLSGQFGSRFGRLPRTLSHPDSSPSRVRHPRGTGDGGAGGAAPRPGNRRAHDSGGEGDGGRSLADGTTWHVGCEPRLPALPLAAYAMRGVARRGWTAHRSPTR